ncbi:MAG TPA: hypothetical protein VF637_02935 [Sphingomicrobium sp.]|jgi:hypothetical protein
MIEITPEIRGPGIEEEYADALTAIADLRRALGERRLTNDTPDGRVLLEVAWVEQEIHRQRLPIPVDASYAGTIYYLVGSNELLHLPGEVPDAAGVQDALGRLWLVLKGYGLIKRRHLPVLIAMIDDFLADAQHCITLSGSARATLADMVACRDELKRGGWPKLRRPQEQFDDVPDLLSCVDNASNRLFRINSSLFDGWRPYPATKPPLAAPVLGLPDRAPPLPAELEGRLP